MNIITLLRREDSITENDKPTPHFQRWWQDSFTYLQNIIRPKASVTPIDNGDLVFELTNNTTLKIKVKGFDGTVRSVTLTLV